MVLRSSGPTPTEPPPQQGSPLLLWFDEQTTPANSLSEMSKNKGEGGAHLIGESPLLRQTNPRVPRQLPS
ncbi:hypothetical protein HanRHA438_Chr14g0676041 [Helianthus annuus]|nr:hypothetical protein HanRHA438_Chr14g0676041 [Helianthus annuus]